MVGEYLPLVEKTSIDELYPLLGLPSEWKEGLYELGEVILSGHELRKFFLRACRYLNENSERPDFSRWPDPVVNGRERPDFFLLLSLLAVREIWEIHRKLSIPLKITKETCLGVGSKSRDFYFFRKEPGTMKWAVHWFLHAMRGELFKIGRFEYMHKLASSVHESLPEKLGGDFWVLDMHIPGGGGMDPATAEASWKESLSFFSSLYPDTPPRAVVCVSWIFSPDLSSFLPADSHLIRLQNLVNLYPVGKDSRREFPSLWERNRKILRIGPRKPPFRGPTKAIFLRAAMSAPGQCMSKAAG